MSEDARVTSMGSSASSTRYETFTEAVPLSLSSMAHASLPLEDGVLDGLKQVLSHTLLSCVNYARIVHPPHQWTFRDLTTSEFAWTPIKGEEQPLRDLPYSLSKLQFKHQYTRNAWIYLKPALPTNWTLAEELEKMKDWTHQVGILGRVSLLYASTEPLTASELDGTDTEDMPPTILYKVVVEYRSLPATGNQQAVQAEELSMSSFGGSVDDDVKYGALAALYDEHAKYVLEIYSVRGKKYKFDLMDSTLSDGTVPRLPSSSEGDPFVKSLCVTVTDHGSSVQQEDQKYAVTRMHLTLEGKPRHGLQDLPPLDYMTSGIKASFLMLNPQPPAMATASPSNHTLLLDPASAGRVYVNGQYVTSWGQDPRIGSHGVALFGMDLLSIPYWRGRIVDYNAMKQAYAQLWCDILIDARLMELNIANRLLHRLMSGHDSGTEEGNDYENDASGQDTNMDCLETQVLSSMQYDRVGIAPKALGTRFGIEFGRSAYPCLEHETEWVKTMLPDRKPIVVPQRLLSILRRGGYFNIQRAADELWFTESRPAENSEKDLVLAAVQLLERAGCDDVSPESIVFVSAHVADDVISKKAVCRYSEVMQQYFVHVKLLSVALSEFTDDSNTDGEEVDASSMKAYLLGMYIAEAHPDGKVLPRYLLRNKPIS